MPTPELEQARAALSGYGEMYKRLTRQIAGEICAERRRTPRGKKSGGAETGALELEREIARAPDDGVAAQAAGTAHVRTQSRLEAELARARAQTRSAEEASAGQAEARARLEARLAALEQSSGLSRSRRKNTHGRDQRSKSGSRQRQPICVRRKNTTPDGPTPATVSNKSLHRPASKCGKRSKSLRPQRANANASIRRW